ncbi:MAG: hypothetical protein ACREI7_10775, partial [Myxococcota bacterium]
MGDGRFIVLIGGSAVGMFEGDDPVARDVLIAMIAGTDVRRQELAQAFGVSGATVERAITRMHQGGLKAVAETGGPGGYTVRTTRLQKRLEALFEQGHGPRAAHRVVAKQASYGTVQSMHKQWRVARDAAAVAHAALAPQTELSMECDETADSEMDDAPARGPVTPEAGGEPTEAETLDAGGAEPTPDDEAYAEMVDVGAEEEPATVPDPEFEAAGADTQAAALEVDDAPVDLVEEPLAERGARKEMSLEEAAQASRGQLVQHVGAWLLVGMLDAFGVHELAAKWRGKSVGAVVLRVALDAAALALVLGHKCVEGVRRLETPTVTTLLRHRGGVSASWVRRVLRRFADKASAMFQATVASTLLH